MVKVNMRDAGWKNLLKKASRLSGEAKLAGAVKFIETLLESGTKFLLFGHH
jgi:hypothetical protein